MALMKSGWLWRQSSILKRWKKNWFDLWMDGTLIYYKDETREDMEDRVHIKFSCTTVKAGSECRDVQPPEGKSKGCLIMVFLRDGPTLTLCAESEDDAVAWKLAMLETKSNLVCAYDPYDDYYQTVPVDSHNMMFVNPRYCNTPYGGASHVIIRENRYHPTEGEQVAMGMLAGAATGAALSSLFWLPCWF
ncbi:pleckstrin homology domain-containing family B member 1 [Protopterus annectens]|uniref:pleckstrin homology domain-containing family B member 1 n=1 Tax=Protopterus annectens TaxID=7888 RepID=UPI001CFC288B|nr:pleckstrin homology domain-containing family B member 1 [Protopterus annectens]